MNKRVLIIRSLMIGLFVFCFYSAGLAQDVRYNYMPGTDFTKFKTYKWVRVPDRDYPDAILDAQIKDAIDSQLKLKGLTKVDEDNADLYITYQVSIDKQTEWNAYGSGFRIGMRSATATSSEIKIGTLVLDFYDLAGKQQVWTGSATKQLNPSKDAQKNIKNLNKAMAKLLKNYPPKASN
jgi:hypothetical protein